jgi:TetR/AcrR family transcriptional regulator, cholesterol catabolism regulator
VSTTRPTRPALRARYDLKQQTLVDDAARVFARKGYDQTSMQDLGEALGIAAGGLYHYFGGKQQLLIRICDALMNPLLAQARELVADGAPAEDQLRRLVRLWVGHVIAYRDHMLVFQQERHVIERGAQWRSVRQDRKEFERLVESVLQRARREGATTGADPRLALSALLGMVNHTAQWFRRSGRLTADEVADGYADLLLGPRSRAPTGSS